MRNKKCLLALMLCACAALAGCQFAKEETVTQSDKYAGVCLRLENWGAPTGYDEYGNPYWENSDDTKQVDLTDAQARALINGEPIDFDTPELPISDRYFYTRTIKDAQGYESTGLEQANWPGTLKNHVSISDTEEKHESDAMVYVTGAEFRYSVTNELIHIGLRIDDVYQRPDGSMYALRGNGGIFGHVDGYSREIKSSESVTDENGVTKTHTVRNKVTIEYVNELETAAIYAFDAQGALLARSEVNWRSEKESNKYDIPAGAAYLVLEQIGINMEGARETERAFANLPIADNTALFILYAPDGTGFANPIYIYAAK